MILLVRFFLEPLKVWDYWPWLLVPLCFAISVVYKSVRVDSVKRVPLEAAKTTAWILAGTGVAAAVLLVVVNVLSR